MPVAADGTTLGSAFVWSDRRAGHEAGALAAVIGGEQPDADHHGTNHHGTNQHSTGTDGTRLVGMRLDAGSVAAKMAWLASHEPERLERGALVAGTPDLLVWRLTGSVTTDWPMASATGSVRDDGRARRRRRTPPAGRGPSGRLADAMAERLPGPVASHTVVGELLAQAAAAARICPRASPSWSVRATGPAKSSARARRRAVADGVVGHDGQRVASPWTPLPVAVP